MYGIYQPPMQQSDWSEFTTMVQCELQHVIVSRTEPQFMGQKGWEPITLARGE